MKKVSRTENCAGFEALQSGMEQDEGSRILLPTLESPHIKFEFIFYASNCD